MKLLLLAPALFLSLALSAVASETSELTITAAPGVKVEAFATYVASKNLWAPSCRSFGPFQLFGGRASKLEPMEVREEAGVLKISVPNLEDNFCGYAFEGGATLGLNVIYNGQQANIEIQVYAEGSGSPSEGLAKCGMETNLGSQIFTCNEPSLGFSNGVASLKIAL